MEDTAVETIRALEDRYVDQHLAVGCRRQPKKLTQGNGGSRKKLAAVRRRMTRRDVRTRHERRSHKGPTVEKTRRKIRTRDNFVRGTPKVI
jgi:hypothetical protein